MATAVGMGFNIDALLKSIQKADKSISDLMDKSNQASKSIITAFQQMSSQGVIPYTQNLEKQLNLYQSIKNEITNVDGSAKRGFGGMKKEIDSVINSLNVMISNLQKTKQWNDGLGQKMGIAREVREMQTRVGTRTGGQAWGVSAESVIKKNQEELSARKQHLQQMEQMYAKMWDSVLAKESKADEERYQLWLMRKHAEEKEHKRIEDAKLKATQDAIAKQNAEYAKNEALRNAQAKTNQQTKDNSARIKSERDAMYKMYEQMFDGIAKKNGQTAEQIIKKNQEELSQRRKYVNEMTSMYERMFDEIARRESQNRASKYGRIQTTGDTSNQALAAYNRLYSDKGVKSINNMNTALQKLRDAQSKLNLNTEEGKNKYNKLGDAIKRVEKDMAKLSQQSENVNKKQSHLLDISGQLQRRLALVFSVSQITGYINKIVQVRGEFELQQRALQAIVQNVDEANKLWDKTVALAVKSPFRVKELVTYTKQLAAYRIETSQLYDTTKRLADVSAGLGVDMQRLILAYGQVRAANFLRGTELRQFTEAGIPMLEELAKHFSELEGRAISVGDVFERISKRMVTFQDVSAVFQRMTDEGGVFYDMQAKQAETLKGQISNLHDAIDLMMNDIGKANDGVLKDTVSILRQLVDNWRAFATVLKQVGVAIALIQLSKFASGWSLVATEGAAAAMAMNGTAGAAARLRVGLKSLFATIKAHPILLIVGALISAGHALWNYIDAIDAANEKYNEMSRREMRRAKTLSDLNDKVLQNNKVIKDNNKKVEEQNEAIKENNEILIKIKKEYPELYNAVVKQTDGTIDLTEAIKTQNEELRANIALQQQAKGDFWQENQGENYEEAVKAQKEYASSIEDLKSKAIDLGYQLEYAFGKGQISEESYKKLKDYLKLISDTNDITELAKIEEVLISTPYGSHKSYVSSQKTSLNSLFGSDEDRELISKFYYNIEQVVDKASKANIAYSNSLKDLWDNFKNQIPTFSTELNKLENAEERGKWLKEQLENLTLIDEKIQEWARTKLIKELEIDIIFPQNNDNNKGELDEWAKRVKAAIEEVNKKIKEANPEMADNLLFPVPEVGQTKEQYLNTIKPALEAAKAIYREGQKIEDESEIKRTNALKPYADAVERILNIQEKSKEGENKALQRLKEQIRLIREAEKAYEDMLNLHGKVYADKNIRKAYSTPFEEAGLGSIGEYSFGTKRNELDNLNKLRDTAQNIAGGALELSKAIAQVQTNIDDFDAEQLNKKLIDQIDNMFGNYEVSLELEKLNIPADLAKRLFGIDAIDLSAIRKEIEKELEIVRASGGNKDQEKQLEERLKKVEELEQKELKERLKRYSQFLIKGQSKAVQLKIAELRELAKLEEDYQNKRIEDADYRLAKKGIQEEYKRKQDDLVWDEFTESDTYIRMFEDLDKVSTSSIRKMIKRIEDMKGSLSDLDPKNVKELIEALEKLKDEDIERNPFRAISSNLKDFINYLKEAKKHKEDLEKAEINNGAAQDILKKAEKDYVDATVEYDRISKDKNATQEEKDAAKKKLDLAKITYNAAKSTAEEASETEEKTRQTAENLKEAALAFAQGLAGAAKDVQEYTDAIAELTGLFSGDLAEFVSGVGGGVSSILGGAGSLAEGLASGNLLPMIQGASGLIGGFKQIKGTFDALHDKKYEKQIKTQQKLVEKLGRQYEELERQIEKAYNIDTLQSNYTDSKENLQQQVEAYDRMIAAEKKKKDSDSERIQEWQDTQKDLLNQIEELEAQAFSEATGGILDDAKSAAREWVDAWYEAFAETGNGLDGLEKHFEEAMLEMIKQQAALVVAGNFTEKWKEQLKRFVNDEDMTLTEQEAKDWSNLVSNDLPKLSENLATMFGALEDAGVSVAGAANMSGLQKGITNITEETADVIAGYLNSIRMFVSEQNEILKQLVTIQGDELSQTTTNPMLSELRAQTSIITTIKDLLGSVIGRGSSNHSGAYLKVWM